MLAALACVDAVVVFDEDDPRAVLRSLRPDVWVKGGDYAVAELPEARALAALGRPRRASFPTWRGARRPGSIGPPTERDSRVASDQLGTVLVTGGSSGLGAAVAAGVEAHGGTADRARPRRRRRTGSRSSRWTWRTPARPKPRSSAAARRRRRPRRVVTAAGTDECGDIHDVDPEDWDRVVLVNLLGTAAVVRAALPVSGRVARAASSPSPPRSGCGRSPRRDRVLREKFGVVGFTRALAIEMGGRVGVTMLIPGGMKTHFFDDRDEEFKPGPDQLLNDPRDVAEAVVFALRQPAGRRGARAARDPRRGALVAVVLVLRALGLGDFLTGVPALRALRGALPRPPDRARRAAGARAAGRAHRRDRRSRGHRAARPLPPRPARASRSTSTAVARRAPRSCARAGPRQADRVRRRLA